jgi:hypothetical protein
MRPQAKSGVRPVFKAPTPDFGRSVKDAPWRAWVILAQVQEFL